MTDNNIVKGVSASLLGVEMMQLLFDLRWMILLAFVLVLVDLRFGIKAAKANGVEIRKSRAGRRTANKLVDYLSYLLIGGLLGRAIGEPFGVNSVMVAASCMGIACLFEIESIVKNVCQSRGCKFQVSLWKMALALLKSKQQDIGEAIEKGIDEKK